MKDCPEDCLVRAHCEQLAALERRSEALKRRGRILKVSLRVLEVVFVAIVVGAYVLFLGISGDPLRAAMNTAAATLWPLPLVFQKELRSAMRRLFSEHEGRSPRMTSLGLLKWLVPRTSRADVELVIFDCEEDIKQMRKEKRSSFMIYLFINLQTIRTIKGIYWEGIITAVCRVGLVKWLRGD